MIRIINIFPTTSLRDDTFLKDSDTLESIISSNNNINVFCTHEGFSYWYIGTTSSIESFVKLIHPLPYMVVNGRIEDYSNCDVEDLVKYAESRGTVVTYR